MRVVTCGICEDEFDENCEYVDVGVGGRGVQVTPNECERCGAREIGAIKYEDLDALEKKTGWRRGWGVEEMEKKVKVKGVLLKGFRTTDDDPNLWRDSDNDLIVFDKQMKEANVFKFKMDACECGKAKHDFMFHARWCPCWVDPMAPRLEMVEGFPCATLATDCMTDSDRGIATDFQAQSRLHRSKPAAPPTESIGDDW